MQAEYKLTVPPVTEADADTFAAERMRAALVRTGKWAGLKVSSTDPGSVKGLQAFAKQTGNELLSTAESGGEFVFLMRKH